MTTERGPNNAKVHNSALIAVGDDGTSRKRSGARAGESSIFGSKTAPRLLEDKGGRKKQRTTRASPRPTWSDWLWGSTMGQWCLLLMAAVALLACNVAVWIGVGGNNDYDTSFIQSLWISWGFFIDPGTQTGIHPSDPKSVMATALVFSIIGFVWNLSVLGMIVEIVRDKLDTWRKERDREYVDHHVLILGWTDKTLFLLKEMIHEANSCNLQRSMTWQDFVVLADRDELEMKQDIRNYIDVKDDLKQHWLFPYFDPYLPNTYCRGRGCMSRFRCRRGHRVICRSGCPYDINDLLAVSVGCARDIIVLGKSGPPRSSDLEVVRVAVALSSLPSKNENDEFSGRMIAETRTVEMAPVLEALVLDSNGKPLCQAIHARSSANRLLCLLATKPVAGDCFMSLCTFAFGEEIYAVPVPQLCGRTFGEACKLQTRAVCIGVKTEKKADEQSPEVSWTDTNGVLSTLGIEGGQLKWSAPGITKRTVDRLKITEGSEEKFTIWGSFGSSTIAHPPPGPKQLPVLAQMVRMAEEVRVPVAGEPVAKLKEAAAAVTIGVSRGPLDNIVIAPPDSYTFGKMDSLLLIAADGAASAKAFDDFSEGSTDSLLSGVECSQIDLMNPIVPELGEGEVQAEPNDPEGAVIIIAGFADDFADLMETLDWYVPPKTTVHVLSRKSAEQRKEALADTINDLQNIRFQDHFGERTDLEAIVKLPFKKASAVLVLAESELEGDADDMCDSTFLNDSACLAIAVLMAGVCDGRFGPEHRADLKSKIICEVLDSRTDQLLKRNKVLKSTGPGIKFFRSNALETGMFAMATSDPTTFNTLVLLLSTNTIGDIAGVPPSKYIGQGEKVSFWELHDKVRQHSGDLLLGWRQRGMYQNLAVDNIDRFEKLSWDKTEKLIIIQKPQLEGGGSEDSGPIPI